jgi:hypothetical protein
VADHLLDGLDVGAGADDRCGAEPRLEAQRKDRASKGCRLRSAGTAASGGHRHRDRADLRGQRLLFKPFEVVWSDNPGLSGQLVPAGGDGWRWALAAVSWRVARLAGRCRRRLCW